MQTFKHTPLLPALPRGNRVVRQAAGGDQPGHNRDVRAHSRKAVLPQAHGAFLAAAAGLSAAFHANPALANSLDHPVVNTAQGLGSAGVALVTASAAAYGGVLILQHVLKGLTSQQQQTGPRSFSPTRHPENLGRTGSSPAWALGVPSGAVTIDHTVLPASSTKARAQLCPVASCAAAQGGSSSVHQATSSCLRASFLRQALNKRTSCATSNRRGCCCCAF